MSARFICRSAEGDGSRGRTAYLRGVWRRGNEVLLGEQRHWCCLASTAARPRGMSQTHTRTHTHSAYTCKLPKQICCRKKNGIQGHFENSRWNVNHLMMKGLQKYPLQKEKKRSSEQRSNVSSLFPAWLAPCKLYADAFPLRHQTKSEMQVEFYVSDIQEVRRICSAIPLATFPPLSAPRHLQAALLRAARDNPPLQICLPFSLFTFILALISSFSHVIILTPVSLRTV